MEKYIPPIGTIVMCPNRDGSEVDLFFSLGLMDREFPECLKITRFFGRWSMLCSENWYCPENGECSKGWNPDWLKTGWDNTVPKLLRR